MIPGTVWETITHLAGESPRVGRSAYFECRRCGTTIDRPDADCPYCGDADVVRYELD